MQQYVENIASRLLSYKGFNQPILDNLGNNNRTNLLIHVRSWLEQFEVAERGDLARITSYLLDNCFIDEAQEIEYIDSLFMDSLINQQGLVARPLCIQGNGRSQRDLVAIYDRLVHQKSLAYNPNLYIYLDDVMFSGGRVYNDLSNYLARLNTSTEIVICLNSVHTLSLWKCQQKLQKKLNELYKRNIVVKIYWKIARQLENRLYRNNYSDILWPMEGTLNLSGLVGYKLVDYKYRTGFNSSIIFNNNNDRLFLEKICLKYGYQILERCNSPHETSKPLGNSFYGYGFGGLIFNYRNCPNSVPLIFWWGSNDADNPLYKQWYPLMPRRTYNN